MLNALGQNVGLVDDAAVGNVGGNDQLAAHIRAVEVVGGIGLGIAQTLRLLQGGVKAAAGGVHCVEHKVCCAVHDAADLHNRLLLNAVGQTGEPGNTAACRRCAAQRDTLFLCQRDKLAIVSGDQQLVGGDNIFAGL